MFSLNKRKGTFKGDYYISLQEISNLINDSHLVFNSFISFYYQLNTVLYLNGTINKENGKYTIKGNGSGLDSSDEKLSGTFTFEPE